MKRTTSKSGQRRALSRDDTAENDPTGGSESGWGQLVIQHSGKIAKHGLSGDKIFVGRKDSQGSASIVIQNQKVSSVHFDIEFEHDKHSNKRIVTLTDRSRNGTIVGSQHLRKGESVTLKSGCKIVIVNTKDKSRVTADFTSKFLQEQYEDGDSATDSDDAEKSQANSSQEPVTKKQKSSSMEDGDSGDLDLDDELMCCICQGSNYRLRTRCWA